MDRYILYKQALKEKYETEKLGKHSSFLLSPTAGKLRDLCIQILNENGNAKDLQAFHNFLGFAFNESSLQKIKNQKDKFKPIATFLKGETEFADSNFAAADMTALLVDFSLRPFTTFQKNPIASPISKPATELNEENPVVKKDFKSEVIGNFADADQGFRKKVTFAIALLSILFMGYIAKQEFYPEKKCLEWKIDHYELAACNGSAIDSLYKPRMVQANNELLRFKKLTVSKQTKFFVNGQPAVWYSKKNNIVEFFNAPGIHPLTGESLRPVTRHIVETYVMNDRS